ncbi:MAG: efflux RND transporter permease subunit, partial [Bdellovibrionaceae bacterium]|nr:efflux RND transporter permease subunit [Pseudobdellovibrionaceae bacterium]
KLSNFGIPLRQVFDVISNSNVNAGGNLINYPNQSFVIRSLGQYQSKSDLEHVGITNRGDAILSVKELAQVVDSNLPLRGVVGRDDKDNIVQGIVLLRKGENPVVVGQAVTDKVKELNNSNLLPEGMNLQVYYNRMNLVNVTTKTVWKNLFEGLVLVFVILLIFLRNLRATLLVAAVVPLSLLFAFSMIVFFHTPANLISLGAIDFGMVVDGAVLIVEMVLTYWHTHAHVKDGEGDSESKLEEIVAKIVKPVFYSMIMIIIAYMPIFTLEQVEGKMFRPLAWTVCFTLAGALLLSLLFIPAWLPWLQKHSMKASQHEDPKWLVYLKTNYQRILLHYDRSPGLLFKHVILLVVVGFFAIKNTGTEFLPELDEGALWIRASFPHSLAMEEGKKVAQKIRKIIKSQEEVVTVISQLGGPEDGTDPNLFDNSEFFVDLKPRVEWKRFSHQREKLIDHLREELEHIPGIELSISQPIADNVEEAVSGVKGKNAAKIYGPDLEVLKKTATEIGELIRSVKGTVEVGITSSTPLVPHLTVKVDRVKVAQSGLNLQDVNDLVEIAVGGKTVTQVYEGETKIDVVLKAPEKYRSTMQNIKDLPLTLSSGKRILLSQVAEVKMEDSPQAIFRENGSRRIGVKFNVEERDLGSVMKDIFAKFKDFKIPTGYQVTWGGEYENQQRAMKRLSFAVPLTVLMLSVLLFVLLKDVSLVGVVLFNLILSSTGGAILLFLRGIPFSVSAGVGVLALLGVVSLSSVTLTSEYVTQKKDISDPWQNLLKACDNLFRPILMTAMLAALAILPAAISTGMGSETQRPLATIVIGGLMTAIPSTLFVLPLLIKHLEHGTMRVLFLDTLKEIKNDLFFLRKIIFKKKK